MSVGGHTEIPAAVLHTDTTADVAFLQVTPSESLIPMVIGSSDDLELGDQLVAYGYPADSEYEGMPVAALGAVVNVVADRSNTVIQSDAMVTSGCSGGPVATLDGRLVGMINATAPNEDQSKFLTCAISVEDILDVKSSWRPSEATSQTRNPELDNKHMYESKNIKGGSIS